MSPLYMSVYAVMMTILACALLTLITIVAALDADVAHISRRTIIEDSSQWLQYYNAPSLTKPLVGNDVSLFISEGIQTISTTSIASTIWYTLDLSLSDPPSSASLKPATSFTYDFLTTQSTQAVSASPPAATSNSIIKFRTVADTLGPAALVYPAGYVGIPQTSWSSLYFDIANLVAVGDSYNLALIRTVKYYDPAPVEDVYTSDGSLVLGGPFLHNQANATSLLITDGVYPLSFARDDDGSTYVLVNSDLSTKLIKYDGNMLPIWKQLTMPLVIDRLSLPTYYVGTIILHNDDHTLFVLSTIERSDTKAWSAYQAVAYSEPPVDADSVQAILAFNSAGQVVWAKLVYPPSGCAWVEWFAVSVSKTDSNGRVHFVAAGDCAASTQPWLQSTWLYHAILTLDGGKYIMISDEHFSVDVGATDGSSASIYSIDIIDDARALVITGEVNYKLMPTGELLAGGDTYVAIIKLLDYSTASITTWSGNVTHASDQSYGLLAIPSGTLKNDGCNADSSTGGIVPLQYVFVTTLDGVSLSTGDISMRTTLSSLCIMASFPSVVLSSTGVAVTSSGGMIQSSSSSWMSTTSGIVVVAVIIVMVAALLSFITLRVYRRRRASLLSQQHATGDDQRIGSGGEQLRIIDQSIAQQLAKTDHQQLDEVDLASSTHPDSQVVEV